MALFSLWAKLYVWFVHVLDAFLKFDIVSNGYGLQQMAKSHNLVQLMEV